MRCEDVLIELQRTDSGAELARRAAGEHLAGCRDCRNAALARAVLRADRDMPIRVPSDDSLHRAIERAVAGESSVIEMPRRARTGTFWLGAGGGQVLVEIQHGDKRRVFLVDVRTTDPAALIAPPGAFTMEPQRV